MAYYGLQIIGLILGGIGMVGTFTATLLPQWKVSAFIGSNIVVFETRWEGLWMNCVSQLNIKTQCRFYPSVLALPDALEAARALMCIAVVLSIIAFVTAITGMECTQCTGDNKQARKIILLTAGVIFILTAILVLIPVSWTANDIIRDFYNPLIPAPRKRELGAALYLGWVSSAFLIAGGAIYCSFHCYASESRSPRYPTIQNPEVSGILPSSCHHLHKTKHASAGALSMNSYV
ncbi:PREDICTED: claudin-17-like [Gavialis gangeticus]|uniref:claudin-17-like n=1 Tax=Gavialis gangeticus TaxID=94835 RepID=UPI00092F1846|nr:PREDICTED: claudin-17-like [Gavialis gangeticus]